MRQTDLVSYSTAPVVVAMSIWICRPVPIKIFNMFSLLLVGSNRDNLGTLFHGEKNMLNQGTNYS